MIIIVTNLPIRNQIEICDFLELALPVQVHRQIFPRFPYPRSENNEIIFSNDRIWTEVHMWSWASQGDSWHGAYSLCYIHKINESLLHLESSFSPSAEEQDFWRNHHEAESADRLPAVTWGKSINTKYVYDYVKRKFFAGQNIRRTSVLARNCKPSGAHHLACLVHHLVSSRKPFCTTWFE